MITNQHFEKLRLQGAPELHAPSSQPEAPRGEVHLFGNTPAFTVLKDLGSTFDELYHLVSRSGKPVLDLGASHSPFSCEAFFHGIQVVSSDLQARASNAKFSSNIENAIERMRPIYQGREVLPGFNVEVMSDKRWVELKNAAIEFRMANHITCSAKCIVEPNGARAEDRAYSVVLSHNAVPLYSPFERFLQNELPELLRVADHQVRLFPLLFLNSVDRVQNSFDQAPPTESELERINLAAGTLGFNCTVFNPELSTNRGIIFTRP